MSGKKNRTSNKKGQSKAPKTPQTTPKKGRVDNKTFKSFIQAICPVLKTHHDTEDGTTESRMWTKLKDQGIKSGTMTHTNLSNVIFGPKSPGSPPYRHPEVANAIRDIFPILDKHFYFKETNNGFKFYDKKTAPNEYKLKQKTLDLMDKGEFSFSQKDKTLNKRKSWDSPQRSATKTQSPEQLKKLLGISTSSKKEEVNSPLEGYKTQPSPTTSEYLKLNNSTTSHSNPSSTNIIVLSDTSMESPAGETLRLSFTTIPGYKKMRKKEETTWT